MSNERTVHSIAAYGLTALTHPFPDAPIPAAQWTQVIEASASHRTLGYAVRAVEDGALRATDAQVEQLHEAHARDMRHAVVLERELLAVVALLDEAGIPARVLKGAAVAHLDHDDPGLRSFQDIDLLIAPTDIDRAVLTLARSGYRRDLPARTDTWDRRFAKDITLGASSGAEIDLHRTLVPGAFGFRIDLDALWAEGQPFEIGGRTMVALSGIRRALHAAYALTAGEATPRLSAARDLMQITRGDDFDVDGLIALATSWRADLLLGEAVRRVPRDLGQGCVPPTLVHWAENHRPDRWQQVARHTYRFAGGTNTTTLLGGVLGLRSTGQRAAYLRGLMFPDHPYRAARRAAHRPAEWRTGARELLRRTRTP